MCNKTLTSHDMALQIEQSKKQASIWNRHRSEMQQVWGTPVSHAEKNLFPNISSKHLNAPLWTHWTHKLVDLAEIPLSCYMWKHSAFLQKCAGCVASRRFLHCKAPALENAKQLTQPIIMQDAKRQERISYRSTDAHFQTCKWNKQTKKLLLTNTSSYWMVTFKK